MATRQYIGARYVTKIYENSQEPSTAEWEAGVTYEPLTLVTYQNSSFLSKKAVPPTISNPPANPNYWVITGAYNGQILQLQSDVSNLQTDVGGMETDIDNIQSDIEEIERKITPAYDRKFVVIADSYGNRVNAGGKTFGNLLEDAGLDIEFYGAYSGAGLKVTSDPTLWLPTYLSAYTGDHNAITDVIYCCSANDNDQTHDQLLADIATSINTTKASYPNARITLIPWGVLFNDITAAQFLYEDTIPAYHDAIKYGAYVADNAEYMLRDTRLLENDLVHPNAKGVDYISEKIVGYLKGQPIDVYHVLPTVYVTSADSDISTSTPSVIYMERHNGNVKITRRSANGILGTFSFPAATLNNSYTHAFDLTDSLVSYPQAMTSNYFSVIGRSDIVGGGVDTAHTNMLIYGGRSVRILNVFNGNVSHNAIQTETNSLFIND